MTSKQELFEQLKDSLKNISIEDAKSSQPVLNAVNDYNYTSMLQDTLDLSHLNYSNTTVTSGGYSLSGAGTTINSAPYYTVGAGVGTMFSNPNSTKINLTGEDADIDINGKSLVKTIEALEERLNILVPNPKLEKEWDQLKELGDQYRALEAKLKEQGEMWEKLKAMPPPKPLY